MILALRRTLALLLAASLVPAGCGDDDEPEQPPLVATLGDSITAGAPRWHPNLVFRQFLPGRPTPKSQWQYWAERATEGAFRFDNCGALGERTDQVELRLTRCAEGADVLVVQGGTNDVTQKRTPASAAASIRRMVRRAKAAGLETLVTTLPPINVRYPRWAGAVRRLNGLIRRIARAEGVPVIDFFAALEDPARPDRMPANLTADGVHPNVEGYSELGTAAARVLEATTPP